MRKWRERPAADPSALHRRNTNQVFLFDYRVNAVGAQQQSVRVDAIGGTGHKRDVILSGHDRQLVHLVGEDNVNLLDFVGQLNKL